MKCLRSVSSASVLALIVAAIVLTGCVSTIGSIVTAPVKAASWGVDKATTSQSEADRNYGRKMRKEEEKRGREERKREKEEQQQHSDS